MTATPAEIYDTYLVPALFEPFAREVIARARPWREDRVLDVACGTGIVACRLASTAGKVTGVDPSTDMLAAARQRAAAERVAVTWQTGVAESLRFPDAQFDLVTCQHGLPYVPDPAAAAREIRRVLAPGGRAIVACWAPIEVHPAYVALDRATVAHLGPIGFARPFSFGDAAALRKLLTDARLFAVQVETVTRPVRFPDIETFVVRSLQTILPFVPELADATPDQVEARLAAAVAEVTPAVARFVDPEQQGQLVFPMTAVIGIGRVKTND